MSVPVPTSDEEIRFIKEFVIPSFAKKYNLNDDDTRENWMKGRQASKGWPVDHFFEELIIIYGSLTREEAAERLKQLHQQNTQGPHTNFGNVVVYFGRQSEKLKVITSFNDLLGRVQSAPKWMKTLRFSDFSLCGDFGKDDHRDVTNDALLATVPATTSNNEKKIVVKLKSKGFSKFKHSQEEALSSIGSLYKHIDYIPRNNTHFPTVTWSLHLSEADFDDVLLRVTEDIMHRNEVIDRELASEYTMREFISPVLIGALRLVLLFLKNSEKAGKLSLICEKVIVGLHAHGPVDYVVVFDYLDIILTEAKKLDIKHGVIQNLLQQRASQEFLTNVLLDYEQIGENRKRCFQEAFDDIASTATCGSATTGSEWIFTKILYDKASKESVVEISEQYSIDLKSTKEDLKKTIKPVLSILVRMIMDQIDALASNTGLATRRRRTLPLPIDVFKVQADEGKKVVNEINESQVEEEEI